MYVCSNVLSFKAGTTSNLTRHLQMKVLKRTALTKEDVTGTAENSNDKPSTSSEPWSEL